MLFVFLSILVSAQTSFSGEIPNRSEEELKKIAYSEPWLRLLQFRRSFPWFWDEKSLLDGPEFFLAPDGKDDPLAELKATWKAFFNPTQKVGALKQPVQCAFPARLDFLKKELGETPPPVYCEKLEEFLGRFEAPESVSLVFSSAYPNNPGSMFGHTFLRINSSGEGAKKHDLLDQTLSYAAQIPPDEGGLAFAILGIFGGYQGRFALSPYYKKVNEYSFSESRDLWEYDLDFTPEETKRLIQHAWELETNTYFQYFFFDENCAYVLLAMLEAAKPSWNLLNPVAYLTPADSVKLVLNTPGALKKVSFRPSLRKELMARIGELSKYEKTVLKGLVDWKTDLKEVKNARVLETYVSYLDYLKSGRDGKVDEKEQKGRLQSLIQRSQLKDQEGFAKLEVKDHSSRPDLGHHTYRLGASSGWSFQRKDGELRYFQELDFKFALHDLLNDDLGFTPYSEINFPEIRLRYEPSRERFWIEKLNLVSVQSIYPFKFLEKKPSWKMGLDYYAPKDIGCETNCHTLRTFGGMGPAVGFFNDRVIFLGMASVQLELGSALRKKFRLVPNAEVGTYFNPFRRYKIQASGGLFWDPIERVRDQGFFRLQAAQSFSISRSFDFRTVYESWISQDSSNFRDYRELLIQLNYYF